MGRKSLETQRRAEILSAFERCIVKYGLDATLEQIADEAQVKRSLIRHYLGNREALVDEVIERITTEFLQQLRELGNDVDTAQLLEFTLDYLFSPQVYYGDTDRLVLQVLLSAQNRYPQGKASLQRLILECVNLLAGDLGKLFPGQPDNRYREVAYSILCLALTNESMMWLGLDLAFNAAARQHAELLIAQLTLPPGE